MSKMAQPMVGDWVTFDEHIYETMPGTIHTIPEGRSVTVWALISDHVGLMTRDGHVALMRSALFYGHIATVHRDGEKIYPKPEPSAEDMVAARLREMAYRECMCKDVARALARDFTITPKDVK